MQVQGRVLYLSSFAFTSALRSTRNWQTSIWPLRIDQCSELCPLTEENGEKIETNNHARVFKCVRMGRESYSSFCAFMSALCSTRNWQISRLPFSAANISGVSSLDDKEKMNETKLKKKKPKVLAEVWEFVIPFGFRIDIGFVLD
jgi:hypothetical protein